MLVFFSIHIRAQLVCSQQECGGEPLLFVIAFAIGLPLKLLLEVGHAKTNQSWTPRERMLAAFIILSDELPLTTDMSRVNNVDITAQAIFNS